MHVYQAGARYYIISQRVLHYQAVITLSVVKHVIETSSDRHKFVLRNCLTHEYVCHCHFVIAIIGTCDRNM